jgi:hypothetical protein
LLLACVDVSALCTLPNLLGLATGEIAAPVAPVEPDVLGASIQLKGDRMRASGEFTLSGVLRDCGIERPSDHEKYFVVSRSTTGFT